MDRLQWLKRKGRSFYALLILSVFLTISGAVMMARVLHQAAQLVIATQSNHLRGLVASADRMLKLEFDDLYTDLDYVLERRGFVLAESTYLETGDETDLLYRMGESLVGRRENMATVIAIRDGEICLSTNGSTDYVMHGELESRQMVLCTDGDQQMYLAFLVSRGEMTYAALMDIRQCYEDIVHTFEDGNTFLKLLSGDGNFLLHTWVDGISAVQTEDLTEADCDLPAVNIMLGAGEESLTASYDLTVGYTGEEHQLMLAMIPAKSSANGFFSVGVSGHFDEAIKAQRTMIVRVVAYGSMIAVGLMLLVMLAVELGRKSRRNEAEVRLLQRKNEEIRRTLEASQELAHHQRLEIIGTMTSSIAHEFNNLLTPIMGYSMMTLGKLPEEDEELCDNVAAIYEASRKAKTIIARLGEMSRKNTDMTFRPVELDAVIVRTLETAHPAQPGKVQVETDLQCPGVKVLGHETNLSQMILNLLLNAYQEMEQGGRLTLRTRRKDACVEMEVQDSGSGMTQEVQQHIFEPFFTTKEGGKGTGLGLAIVQQVVENHQGEITVESTLGQGTTFRVRLPVNEEEK